MEKQVIISISREYGSGGHLVAEKIAQKLNLPFYDRKILEDISACSGTEIEELEKLDEQPRNILFSRRLGNHSTSMEDHLVRMQFEYLKKKADRGESFVVVGRCSEVVLQDRKGLITVFIVGDKEEKIQNIMDKFKISREDAEMKRVRHDRRRKMYHNEYSEIKWGDSRGYDICLNVSRLGIEKTAEFLEDYIRVRMENFE